jgi:hypothetical protein
VFVASGLQPLHTAGADASKGGGDAQRPADETVAGPTALPARNSATARFSSSLSSSPCRRMAPVVSAATIDCGGRSRSSAIDGMRGSFVP